MKSILLIVLGIISCSQIAFSQDQIKGYWLPAEQNSIIEINDKNSESLNGKIVWLERPTNRNGDPHTDRMNPDKTLRDRPILGLEMISDLTHEGGKWRGKLYSPKKGRTVDVVLSLMNPDKLKLTVSFKGFTRDQYWVRTELPK